MQGEADRDRQAAVHHGGRQAAVKGRCQVVRVAFHGVGDVQQALGAELIAPQHICAHGARHQQSGRGPQASADGDMGIDVDLYTPDLLAERGQHGAVRGIGQVVRPCKCLIAAGNLQPFLRFFEGHIGVQAQRAAESIKPGSQVGRGGRHADGYLVFHLSVSFYRCGKRSIDN